MYQAVHQIKTVATCTPIYPIDALRKTTVIGIYRAAARQHGSTSFGVAAAAAAAEASGVGIGTGAIADALAAAIVIGLITAASMD